MRPTPRLLFLALGALGLTGLLLPAGASGLIGLLWMSLVLAVFVDLSSSLRRRFRADLQDCDQIFASETRDVVLRLDPPAPQGLRLVFDWPDGIWGPGEVEVDAGQDSVTLQIGGRRRGEWPIGRIWPRWPSRFGLMEFAPRVIIERTVTVLPDIRPITQGQIDLAVHTSLHGQKDSYAEGEGSEFHQLRDFVAGESLRKVDWKRSARQRRLLSKETRAERNHNVVVALDTGYLMREEFGGMAKLDHAINAALAVAWAATVGGDKVGLYTYDSRPRTWLPPEAGRQMFPKLRRTLAAQSYESRESNHTLALATLNGYMRRRSLLIVFSDFVDTTTSELMVEQIGHMSRRHLVIFIALRDPEISRRSSDRVDTLDDAAEAVAATDMQRERRIVLERLQRLGVLVLDTEPAMLTAKLVSTYLELKAREAA